MTRPANYSKDMFQKESTTTRNLPQRLLSNAPHNDMNVPKIDYLRVVDFDKFLHYRDRSLVWIKSYVAILDEYYMTQIPDAQKYHMHAIVLLAARLDNRIPYDAEFVRISIKATEAVDLDAMIEWGLLEKLEPDSNSASKFASKLVPTRKQKRSESASKIASESASENAPHKKNLAEQLASTEQSRAEAEQSRAEKEAAGEPRARDTRTHDARDARASGSPPPPPAAALSIHPLSVLETFVAEMKPHAERPKALAIHLHRTGEDDSEVTDWKAKKQAWAEKVAQQEREKQEQEEGEAKYFATTLIQQGGIRSSQDSVNLLTAISFFDKSAADKLGNDFNAKTFRQLKKLAPYAVRRIEAEIRENPEQAYLQHWIEPLLLYCETSQPL